jgi:hypothetical protein
MKNKTNSEKRQIKCPSCSRELMLNGSNFYKSSKLEYEKTDGFCYICKQCLRSLCYNKDNTINLNGIHQVLQTLDKPFIKSEYMKILSKGSFDIGSLLKNVSFNMYAKMTYADSDKEEKEITHVTENQNTYKKEILITDDDKKNEEDVIRILGYDPFITDSMDDRRLLFNSLIDFLDEETQADNFKCLTVIEIVKLFNQSERINLTINSIMKDYKSIADNSTLIKSLMDTKKNMLTSALALAKDNGISVNHNNNKSKGGNTLNGIIRKLDEIGLDEARINLFNLETCEAMKQIADISNKSILDQLVLDENDYTTMITQQKEIIKKMDEKIIALEEENRLLKIKIKYYEDIEKENSES